MLNVQGFESDSILVKGMEITYQIRFKPLFTFFYISISYYCKNTQLESKAGILETENEFKFIEHFSSTEIENDTSRDKIHNNYLESRRNILTQYLGIKKEFDANEIPADIDSIIKAEHRLNIKFPRSYLDFLKITNGFTGILERTELVLFRVEDINEKDGNFQPYYENHKSIIIGEIAKKKSPSNILERV